MRGGGASRKLVAMARRAIELESRVADLESELATLRESAGLERRVFEVLTAGEREHSLQLRKHGVGSWMSVHRTRDGKQPVLEAEDLPSLLRAILEVEGG
jgi:hypothetical protein